MANINMHNVVWEPSKKTNNSFINGLKNTPAFRVQLSDYSNWIKILILISRAFTFIFYLIFTIIRYLFLFIVSLCKKSRIFTIILLVVIAISVLGLIDYIINYGKVYPGVYVGNIDLSGKTLEESESIINDNFSYRLSGNEVVIYVSDEAKEKGETSEGELGLSEQLSVDQAKQTIKYWKTNSIELDADFPVKDIAYQAMYSTRGFNNIFKRLGTLFFKQDIKPYAVYNDSAINEQISKINDTIGAPLINPTCNIEDGVSYPVDGCDGFLINKNEFLDQLNEAFFQGNKENCCFVPVLHEVKQQVTFKSAQVLSEKINHALSKEVIFNYKGNSWKLNNETLSNWINISVEDHPEEKPGCSCSLFSSNFCIIATVDGNKTGADIIAHTKNQNINNGDYIIQFYSLDNKIMVKTEGNSEIPSIYETIDKLNTDWLENAIVYEGNRNSSNNTVNNSNYVNIDISSTKIPENLSLEEAMNIGVVSTVSSYTTTFSSGAGTENRNHNIDLGASLINNSICKANGGRWSFNDTCGNCSEERGFLEAGAIVGDRYTKSVGGGICQVATTVFNAVYESGCPVLIRHNHDLHMASYPAGRDAAINYPDLDLVWLNNLNSDILVQSTTNGYSVTCDLIGINPQYIITTDVGEWEEGEPYKTEVVVDVAKKPDSKFTQTSGSTGKSIVIKRNVYDKNGKLLYTDEFVSRYNPKTEIIVLGPGEEANRMLAEKTARLKKEDDNW